MTNMTNRFECENEGRVRHAPDGQSFHRAKFRSGVTWESHGDLNRLGQPVAVSESITHPKGGAGSHKEKRTVHIRSLVTRERLALFHSATVAAFHLQFSGASFAFVARKLETSAGRNCSVQFCRFKQRFPATVHKINVELVSPRHADLPYTE
jgi:hypothetical protein